MIHRPLRSLVLLTALASILLGGCRAGPVPADGATSDTARAPDAPRGASATPAGPAETAASTLERLIELGHTDNRVQEHLEHLCIDIGPRLTGSTRLQQACEWTRDVFASYGLTASLEAWGEFPVGFDRGPWHGGIVSPEARELEFNTMAWTPGTNGPQRGPALAFPCSEEELAALSDRLTGAWLVRPPAAELKDESGTLVFEKPVQPSRELVEEVHARMLEKGALGEVRGARSELLVTDGNYRITWDDLPRLVEVRVRRDQHDDLWARMQGMQSGAVELEFDIDNRFVQGPVTQYNVVADLTGSEKPEEVVIVCGHLDSWDGAQGAVDNGTGCATTIEAARLLTAAGARPGRTIRFILWTGEEQGLFGSRAYVEAHPELLPRISAVLNHDEGTNWLSGLRATKAMFPAMQEVCAPLATLDPEMPFELEEVDAFPGFIGSDSDSFVQVGVPGFFWRQSGRSDYEHHHHTQYDTFDAAIPEYQRHSALVAAVTAFRIANLPELLDRTNMKAPEPRRMGVQLDRTKVSEVMDGTRAAALGLQVGDVILAIDGTEVRSQGTISRALREGGSAQVVRVQRGEEVLEFTFDWSDDPDEPRRLEQIRARAERDAARRAEREDRRGERGGREPEGDDSP